MSGQAVITLSCKPSQTMVTQKGGSMVLIMATVVLFIFASCGSLFARGIPMPDEDGAPAKQVQKSGLWIGGNTGAIIALQDITGGGFTFHLRAEYPNAINMINAGLELGYQSFGEADGGNVTLSQVPINVFANMDVADMIGMSGGLGVKPGIGLGLFNVSDNIDGSDSAMRFGLSGQLAIDYMLQDNLRIG